MNHENCILCELGWPKDHEATSVDGSTEAEDAAVAEEIERDRCWLIGAWCSFGAGAWEAYMTAQLDLAFEQAGGLSW
jgi:hypothetical protein